MDELKAISTFVRAAELGSFNKAAQVQGTTPQAVSKTVRLLEQRLGVRLIHRTTRHSALTDDGQRLFDAVRSSLAELRAALERARRSAREQEGVVRVSARPAIGRRVLLPLVTTFREQFPGIEFDLLLEERDIEPVGSRVDVSLLAGEQPAAHVIARRLFPISKVICAAPGYLAARPVPHQPADLLAHRCIGHRLPGSPKMLPWVFVGPAGREEHAVPVVLCCSDPEAELQAVLSGIGIGRIDSITAADDLRSGRLVPLLMHWASDPVALHLCYAQRDDMPARVRLFIDYAMSTLRDPLRQD